MGVPGAVEALLRHQLPPAVANGLKLETAKPVPTSFVDRRFKRRRTDLLFIVETVHGETRFIFLLMEHKSTRVRLAAVQLLGYLAAIYDQWELENGSDTTKPAPETLPLIVYHGADPWNAPTRFAGLYEQPEHKSHLSVDFGYILVDLSTIADDAMPQHNELRAGLLALKHAKQPTLPPEVADLIAEAISNADLSFREVTWTYIVGAFPVEHNAT